MTVGSRNTELYAYAKAKRDHPNWKSHVRWLNKHSAEPLPDAEVERLIEEVERAP